MAKPRRRWWPLSTSFVILSSLLVVLTGYAWMRSPALALEGLSGGVMLFLNILPSIAIGFLLGGLVQVLIPQALLAHYAGEGSGLRGLLIATGVGVITPGGPFVQFPLVASLWKAGTGVGPIAAYLVAWSLMGFQRIIVYEGPLMGWRFVIARISACLVAPMAVGYVTAQIYRYLTPG